jgi:hypothetical protein
VVDLLGQDAAHHRTAVLERDGGVVRDRCEQSPLGVAERRVAVAHELTDLTPLPAQRHPHGVPSRTPVRPRDLAVLEDERRTGRVDRLHGGFHDCLERLLQIERFRHGFGDAGQRLEFRHTLLRVGVQLCVHDRLRDLRRDRDEEVDLVLRELARRERPDVQSACETLARENRHGENRLVLVLAQVRERLEPRIEVRLRRDHDGSALRRRHAGDPFSRPHPRASRHLFDARAVSRAKHELVLVLVIEVDEARVRMQRVGDLARDEREHLLEIE